jgi:uncharacterized protein YaiI (UPF0178 family)
VADNEIVKRVQPGELVITGDIPLAAEVLEKGAVTLVRSAARYSTSLMTLGHASASTQIDMFNPY